MKICLIEDNLDLGRALQAALQDAGKEVTWVRAASDARHLVEEETFDALLLDLGLPDGNGIDLLRDIRGSGKTVPILVITSRDSLEDRLSGLDFGADDYLVKPFNTTELLARLRAVVRRATGWNEVGDISRHATREHRRTDRDPFAEGSFDHIDRRRRHDEAATRDSDVLVTTWLGELDAPQLFDATPPLAGCHQAASRCEPSDGSVVTATETELRPRERDFIFAAERDE